MRSPAATMFWRLVTALVVVNCIAACADSPTSPAASRQASGAAIDPPHTRPLDSDYVTSGGTEERACARANRSDPGLLEQHSPAGDADRLAKRQFAAGAVTPMCSPADDLPAVPPTD